MANVNEKALQKVKEKLEKHFEKSLTEPQMDQLRDYLKNNLTSSDIKFFPPETEFNQKKIEQLASLIEDQIQHSRQSIVDWKWSHKF